MGLISDVVQSFVQSFTGIAQGFKWIGDQVPEELARLAEDFKKAGEEAIADPSFADIVALSGGPATFFLFTAIGLADPKSFTKELFVKWDTLLKSVLAELNVEVDVPSEFADGSGVGQIAFKLTAGRLGAQRRVTAAMTAINFIVLSGNGISVAAEIASVGTVRSIAEAIQSWIWANGLGSFSPLAFSPQVTASINPYLTRWYNSRAQAQLPAVTDIIRFQLREVYLEGRREELVGTEERPVYDALMAEWGFDKFHADSYWGAHWQLPSVGQLNEMLFRGVIDVAEWERFVRFNDLEPTSIPRLRAIIFNPYTRVDVRRMARFGLLSDDDVLQAYADLGFFAETSPDATGRLRAQFNPNPDFTIHKAQALTVFTKVFNALPELRRRFSKGWITPTELRAELAATGIPESRVQPIFETMVKEEGPARTLPERELTRALVARAWKLRLISFPQARFLLERMGWDFAEAELILMVQSQPDDPLAFVPTTLGVRLGTGLLPASELDVDEGAPI